VQQVKAIDRTAVRVAYRPDENEIALERIRQARLAPTVAEQATSLARALVNGVRARKPSGIDAFLHTYDLGSDEGIALMCLAEALLRIPDAHTADELIADKLSKPQWAEKIGESDSAFVNAATFSLLLTGKVIEGAKDRSDSWRASLGRAVGRLGEPVVRAAVREAMKILGRNFVFGRNIDEALRRAAPERAQGLTHSFDMLGEAARTFGDAERYAQSYARALDRIAKEAKGGFRHSPGISVKLSALHPRYEWSHADEAKAAILPVLCELAGKASAAEVHFTIDAEEADRLELQMDLFEALGWPRNRDPGVSEACRAIVRLGSRTRPYLWPPLHGSPGQRRLLGHRDQGGAGRRPQRLSSIHAQGDDGRLLPCLRQEAARRERCHLSSLCDA
jgi:RHH-type proline utilization regulon transcriptional repressor/proline dehydrogenase/delta 1-pyrroline-5-carboxylate dehydrogenase